MLKLNVVADFKNIGEAEIDAAKKIHNIFFGEDGNGRGNNGERGDKVFRVYAKKTQHCKNQSNPNGEIGDIFYSEVDIVFLSFGDFVSFGIKIFNGIGNQYHENEKHDE